MQIKFQQVLLAGTPSYTVIGRPFLKDTQVRAMVQSISDSEKVIVFKKKRRKQYKKSFGSRVSLTSVRITNIKHKLSQYTLKRSIDLLESQKKEQRELQQKLQKYGQIS